MDYVVFGTGYGATLMVLGWALRTFGPGLRYQQNLAEDTPASADLIMARLSWRRFCAALGTVIATSGIALTIVTFLIIFINPGDNVGSRIAWTCFALIVLGVAAWAWLYVERYGIYGILPKRQELTTAFRSATEHSSRPHSDPSAADIDYAPVYDDPDLLASDESRAVETGPLMDENTEFQPGFLESERPSPDAALADEDELPEDDWIEDQAWEEEQEARYSKYELHHPEDVEGELAVSEDRDVDEISALEESVALDIEDDGIEPSPLPVTSEAEDPSPTSDTDSNKVEEVVAESPLDLDDADPELPIEKLEAEDDEDVPAVDDVDVSDLEVVDEQDQPASEEQNTAPQELADTPEGRAEALKRIEEWQPSEPQGNGES